MFLPSTRVDVYRDANVTDVDIFGDATETSSASPIFPSVLVSLSEDSESRGTSADLNNDVVRTVTVRAEQRADIREGDRLRDLRSGFWYQVQKVTAPQSFFGVAPCRLTCKRIGT